MSKLQDDLKWMNQPLQGEPWRDLKIYFLKESVRAENQKRLFRPPLRE
jgi:hypothetical protein